MCRQGEPEDDAMMRRRVAAVLTRSVEDLPLSARTLGLLRKAYVKDVADIVLKTEDELRYYVGLRENPSMNSG
jgi:DNA-directed RNA polymerase alpha subunit